MLCALWLVPLILVTFLLFPSRASTTRLDSITLEDEIEMTSYASDSKEQTPSLRDVHLEGHTPPAVSTYSRPKTDSSPTEHPKEDLLRILKPSSSSLAVLREIQNQTTGRHFHEGTHILYDLRTYIGARPVTYLEIGSYTGNSASLMLKHPYKTSIVAVDPCVLEPSHYLGSSSQEDTIRAALSRIPSWDCDVKSPWDLRVGYSPEALPSKLSFDIIFIDGDHSTQGVWTDYNGTVDLLRPGGFMVFDDYLDFKDSPEVKGAVDDIAHVTSLQDIGLLDNQHGAFGHGEKLGEYIFRKAGSFEYGPAEILPEAHPVLCILISTYERNDGSTPGLLENLWQNFQKQSYKNWRLFLVGDKYENMEEWTAISFASDLRVSAYNMPEAGERGKLSGEMTWKNAGVEAINHGISQILDAGHEWVVRLDDDDYWDHDHLQNIVSGIQTGATFVMTGAQFINLHLPLPRAVFQSDISNDVIPLPCQVIHSSVAFNVKALTSRYQVSHLPADAYMWSRIIFDEKFFPAYVPVESVHHLNEKGSQPSSYVGRKWALDEVEAPSGWIDKDDSRYDTMEYTSIATKDFPMQLSQKCVHVIGPASGEHGFIHLVEADVPYYIRSVSELRGLRVWTAQS